VQLYSWLREDLIGLHPDLDAKKNLETDLFYGTLRDFYRTAVSSGVTLVLTSVGFDSQFFAVDFHEDKKEGVLIDVLWSAILYRIGVTLSLRKLTSYSGLYKELCSQVERHLTGLLAPQFVIDQKKKDKPVQPASRMFYYVAALLEDAGASKENWPLARQAYLDFLLELTGKNGVLLSEINSSEAQLLAEYRREKDQTAENLVIEPKTVSHRKE
jgi:hypothetical protein